VTAPDPVRAGRALNGAAAAVLLLEGIVVLFVPRGIAQSGPGLTGVRLVLLLVLAALGAGLGVFTPANNSAIMGSAPPHRLGVAGGVLNMTRSIGTSLGVAATGAVLALRLAAEVGHPVAGTVGVPAHALTSSFQQTLAFLAALAVVAAAISSTRGAEARLRGQAPAPLGVLREEVAQVDVADLRVVL
jgi:hypothetical protein